jgi:taurine dioxygenase
MGSVLHLHTVPAPGGDTLFASMYAAYDSLSPRMKAYLDGLTAFHSGERSYRRTNALLGVDEKPDFQVRFRWEPNSVAFWDNRAVQHIALWDYFPQVRSGNRVTIKGDRPY